MEQNFWKHCSSCKKEIPFGAVYQLCTVSTCRLKKTGLVFCSVECWDAHLGFANHRDAAAEETRAPSRGEYLRLLNQESQPTMSTEPQKKNHPPYSTIINTAILYPAIYRGYFGCCLQGKKTHQRHIGF